MTQMMYAHMNFKKKNFSPRSALQKKKECLLYKHETLSSSPGAEGKKKNKIWVKHGGKCL
jgi:hypothetical protein